MKIKGAIYFAIAVAGAIFLGFGENFMPRAYALSVGIVLLMFGLYKISSSWQRGDSNDQTDD